MTNWKQLVMSYTIPACRSGWLGAWDAIKAAITRKPRLTVPQNYTLSMWVKPAGSAVCDVELMEGSDEA